MNPRRGGARARTRATDQTFSSLADHPSAEVVDRLDAIGSLAAYALLGELPADVVLEATIVLAERAAQFIETPA